MLRTKIISLLWYLNDTLDCRGNVKRDIVLERGETFITIPCWWDGELERYDIFIFSKLMILFSLASTIRFTRPDLLRNYPFNPLNTIPFNPPSNFFECMSFIYYFCILMP